MGLPLKEWKVVVRLGDYEDSYPVLAPDATEAVGAVLEAFRVKLGEVGDTLIDRMLFEPRLERGE